MCKNVSSMTLIYLSTQFLNYELLSFCLVPTQGNPSFRSFLKEGKLHGVAIKCTIS